MSSYRFQYPGQRNRLLNTVLPAGDYQVTVVDCGEPGPGKNNPNNVVLPVTLAIQPSGQTIYYYPWCGVDKNGEYRDSISEFLLAINRVPKDIKIEPEWGRLIGAKGKVKLKVGKDQNDEPRNEVAFFYTPKQIAPTVERQSVSKNTKQVDPDLEPEPDDIPF